MIIASNVVSSIWILSLQIMQAWNSHYMWYNMYTNALMAIVSKRLCNHMEFICNNHLKLIIVIDQPRCVHIPYGIMPPSKWYPNLDKVIDNIQIEHVEVIEPLVPIEEPTQPIVVAT
jgi:hypothetical protein